MGETDLHRDEMVRLIQTLQTIFAADDNVYVSGDLMFYYVEGDPSQYLCPDVMVIKGVSKQRRDIYKLWEEGRAPSVVIEVTSKSTRQRDLVRKREIYASWGVEEYYLYDPRAEYLQPPFQAFALRDKAYAPLALAEDGGVLSPALGLRLRLVEGQLCLFAVPSGELLLDRAAAAERRAEAEARERVAQAARAEAAERRVAELEALLKQREQNG